VSAPVISSIGLASGLGQGIVPFLEGWRAGGSGIAVDRIKLRALFPERRAMLRRMDRLSRMICLAAGLARDDVSGLGDPAELALGVGTDLGTLEETWAFLTRLRDKGPALANPMDFPNLVPNAGAGYAGIFCGLQGPSHTFCQHGTCGDEAIAWAADGVRSGWFVGALAGGAEELSEVRGKATEAGRCLPADAPAGESAVLVLVERAERAAGRGATPLARYLGSWAACAPPLRSPYVYEPPGEALDRLLERALDEADVSRDRIGVVLGSRPGLLALDAPESDHQRRLGVHPADGALRVALAACLLADPTLPVHDGGPGCSEDVAVIASAARGGSIRVTLLGRTE
jgi:3-oxoacyl-[acyl-carrier-protein] synthase II